MKDEKLITELCEVIKESEVNTVEISNILENLLENMKDWSLDTSVEEKISNHISDVFGLMQYQDMHRQRIERVINYVCENNNIDPAQYNIAPSAKYIQGDTNSDIVSDDELAALINEYK